ncbi:MAG: ATP-binding protein [Ktedonobacteraceae bacterium]|nr:ATP-binding protein [Ktedonobacteraceae bacterium]
MEQIQQPAISPRQLSAEAAARLKQFKEYAVLHPQLAEVDRQLTRAIEEPAGFAYVLLYGPSGVGKTTILRQIERRYKEMAVSSTPSLLTSLAHLGQSPSVPLLVMETRPPDGLAFNRTDYYRTALKQFGEYTYERRTIVDIDAETTWEQKKGQGGGARGKAALFNDAPELRRALEETLRRRGVQAVLLDEAQHLLKISSGVRLIDQLDWLKSMTNVTGVVHVLIGTYELLTLRHLNGQAARRGLEIHFPRYQWTNEPDQRTFQGVLLTLLQQVPLAVEREALLQHWPYFYERSIGCVGVLKDWLVRAVAATLADGQSVLTLARLQEYALPEAQCESMAMEAASGELELHYTASRREHLWNLLGMSAATARKLDAEVEASTHATGAAAETEETLPQKKTTRRGGERSPGRDPVGLREQAVEKPEKCAFSGAVVNLSPAQLAQAALAKLQCPECGAIWTARARGETVTFPPHPPRTNKRAQVVSCWIRQGATWTLPGKSV